MRGGEGQQRGYDRVSAVEREHFRKGGPLVGEIEGR